ncbi:MAG: DNA-directed RNA polymerase subunit beta [Planctomycetota bacterium]
MEIRNFGQVQEVEVPSLSIVQVESYAAFLQAESHADRRKNQGLQQIFKEFFPIKSYDGVMQLEFVRYEFGKPRYTPDECRSLRLTYGSPLKVRLRLKTEEAVEEDVYFGDLPRMLGGGEFIINGAERAIVSQLHRAPGVDFSEDVLSTGRTTYICRIMPERGSWIEMHITKKDALVVRIDQSGKIPVTCFLRALTERLSTDDAILREFYKTEVVSFKGGRSLASLKGKILVVDVVHPKTGEVLAEGGQQLSEKMLKAIKDAEIEKVEVIEELDHPYILNTLQEDATHSHEEALLKIYAHLRPGNPAVVAKAKDLVRERFFDEERYRLGAVGRFRINRKFGTNIPETSMKLTAEDVIQAVKYMVRLRKGQGEVDDIDHLGNRRVRTVGELATQEIRQGFIKLRRTIQERMNFREEKFTPRMLVNAKIVSSAIEYFFGRGELSQVVDQTNPLAQLTHERRLSALGPGGLNRKRAGFEVRDVHPSHYGRVCPIETPEGPNIGLITSLAIYAKLDKYGFLTVPYRIVKNGKVTNEVQYLRADEEFNKNIAPADVEIAKDRKLAEDPVLARYNGEFRFIRAAEVDYMDVAPAQLVGVSAALVPFLEHDDANRALMGSNMQRQAVPLMVTEAPIVVTGMEDVVARNSGMVVTARRGGVVTQMDAERIVIDGADEYVLRKFKGLNERTCCNQKPAVEIGQRVKKGQVIADGPATSQGELSLGKNVLVGFMTYDGSNFEDAIVISERMVRDDAYTSIHIEEFQVEIRETQLGREEFTRDIPNVSERALASLDEHGVVRVGTYVRSGDILVGKISPKSKSELTPEEKLLHAIFGKAGEDVKNDSLEVPSGVEGVVITTERFSRKSHLSENDRRQSNREADGLERRINVQMVEFAKQMFKKLEDIVGVKLKDTTTGEVYQVKPRMTEADILALEESFDIENVEIGSERAREEAFQVYQEFAERIEALKDEKDRKVSHLKRGDELPTGVLEMANVYVATKRKLAVGDKMAGRHGNKGVIARIVPVEDMPFMADGTPIEILLNPLGVPSRMNVGQILETQLGWAAKALGFKAITPVFDGCTELQIQQLLKDANLPDYARAVLYDGRTGQPFHQTVTVGYIYMMKLNHLVDDKVHARSTGPYSLITQQPLGGKARFGGQRFGEMEVWALEAYGASNILQELLTVKSDDVDGRTRIYESMVKGENNLEPGIPLSFKVLTNELRGLCLSMKLERADVSRAGAAFKGDDGNGKK